VEAIVTVRAFPVAVDELERTTVLAGHVTATKSDPIDERAEDSGQYSFL
jgi:hypothetical protein